MKALLIVVAVVVALLVLLWRRRAPVDTVTVAEIPAVVAKLHGLPEGELGTWVVFMFHPPGSSPGEDEVNLQYSVEEGTVGLDWVLISTRNIADKEKLMTYMRNKGFTVSEKESNSVKYLRAEGGGIDQLGVKIITEFYGISAETPLEFDTEGFEWAKT